MEGNVFMHQTTRASRIPRTRRPDDGGGLAASLLSALDGTKRLDTNWLEAPPEPGNSPDASTSVLMSDILQEKMIVVRKLPRSDHGSKIIRLIVHLQHSPLANAVRIKNGVAIVISHTTFIVRDRHYYERQLS